MRWNDAGLLTAARPTPTREELLGETLLTLAATYGLRVPRPARGLKSRRSFVSVDWIEHPPEGLQYLRTVPDREVAPELRGAVQAAIEWCGKRLTVYGVGIIWWRPEGPGDRAARYGLEVLGGAAPWRTHELLNADGWVKGGQHYFVNLRADREPHRMLHIAAHEMKHLHQLRGGVPNTTEQEQAWMEEDARQYAASLCGCGIPT